MKRLLVLLAVFVLAVAILAAPASASGPVVGTYSVADLGQGIWGGGPLYADGSAGGNVPLSAGNGQVIGQLQPTSWSTLGPGWILLCYDLVMIKNASSQPPPPPSFCAPLPVTGTPVKIDDDGDGKADFIMRVTLNH